MIGRRPGSRYLAATLSVMAATPALAGDVLPIGGVFGNAEGCLAYETGHPRPDYLLLTGATFSSAQVGCAFLSLTSTDHAAFTVTAICSPGGNQSVRIVDHGVQGYAFVVGSGSELGPLLACEPSPITGAMLQVPS